MYNIITNLELNFIGSDLPYFAANENIAMQMASLTPQKAYENACCNLQRCKGQTAASFSIFPNSLKKAFDKFCPKGAIIFDTANQDLACFEEFVSEFPNEKIYLGTSSLKANHSKNLDHIITTVYKHKKSFFIKLCEDLYSAGEFCGNLRQNSEILFAYDCGLFAYGGGISGLSLVDKEEISLLAQKDILCIFSPTATLMQGFDLPKLYTFYSNGAKICIATDNLYSDTFNIEAEIKLASILTKSQMSDSTLFPYEELLKITQNNAKFIFE